MSGVQQKQGKTPVFSSVLPKRTSADSWQLPQATHLIATHLICGALGGSAHASLAETHRRGSRGPAAS